MRTRGHTIAMSTDSSILSPRALQQVLDVALGKGRHVDSSVRTPLSSGRSGSAVARVCVCYSYQGRAQTISFVTKETAGGVGTPGPLPRPSIPSELCFYRSRLIDHIPKEVRAPRLLATFSSGLGRFVLCLEDLGVTTRLLWRRDDFFVVGRAVGALNAQCSGDVHREAWMTGPPLAAWSNATSETFDALDRMDGISHQHIRALKRLATRRLFYLSMLNGLPGSVCHNDVTSTNVVLMPREEDGHTPVGLTDWSLVGKQAFGSELSALVATHALFGEGEPQHLDDYGEASISGYLLGLSEYGVSVSESDVRAGYAAASALRLLRRCRLFAALASGHKHTEQWEGRYGRTRDEMLKRFADSLEYYLDL